MALMGWQPPSPRTAFDVLPIVIDTPGGEAQMFHLPREVVHQVDIRLDESEPHAAAFNKLGLRWAAVPTISGFNTRLGGIDYTACPFNGWFAEIEIARNLAERYDMLPKVADAFQLDTSSLETLWKERANHELSRAIVASFQRAKMSIVDRYTVSAQFMTHVERERAADGRRTWR